MAVFWNDVPRSLVDIKNDVSELLTYSIIRASPKSNFQTTLLNIPEDIHLQLKKNCIVLDYVMVIVLAIWPEVHGFEPG
jgi:hypothetical protein